MLFQGWDDLIRILVVGSSAYVGLIILLRSTGKRTLAKMNAFDLVITVAFGSLLATVLLSSDVSLSEGLVAFALLCGLQYVVALGCLRSERFQRLIKAEPTLLYFQGRALTSMLSRERVTEEEVYAAIREQGFGKPSEVGAVVLETDGSFSVIGAVDAGEIGSLRYVAPDAPA
jgi:uncharacterized membrane protein YcaP (DUF421 family)